MSPEKRYTEWRDIKNNLFAQTVIELYTSGYTIEKLESCVHPKDKDLVKEIVKIYDKQFACYL